MYCMYTFITVTCGETKRLTVQFSFTVFQELTEVLQVQQRSLEEKEQQLTETGNRVDQAENQHKLLKEKLSGLQHSSQHVAMEAADLVKKSEELELELAKKEKLKERLLAQKSTMKDMELLLQMIDEVQVCIDDIKNRITQLKSKIEQQKIRETELKEEIARKQKEVDNRNQTIQASQKEYSLVWAKLSVERRVFDFKLRQEQQSSAKILEELKVGLVQCKQYITHIHSGLPQSSHLGSLTQLS